MNDTTRDAFEAWFLNYRKSTWQPLSSDARKEMPRHWNINCEMDYWTGWQAATLAAKRQPLTDEQVRAISLNTCTAEPGRDGFILPYSFARAIEAAHGIKA